MKLRRGAHMTLVRRVPHPMTVEYVHQATWIPDGMHGHQETYWNEGWRDAGMHQFRGRAAGYMQVAPASEKTVTGLGVIADDIERSLVRKGVHPERAHAMVGRAMGRVRGMRRHNVTYRHTHWRGMGDSTMTYDQVMTQAQNAAASGDPLKRLQAATAISDFLSVHAPNINNDPNDTGDLTNDQVNTLDTTVDSLTKGVEVPKKSVIGAAASEFGRTLTKEISDVGNKVSSAGIASLIPWQVWAGGGAVAAIWAFSKLK